MRIRALFLLLVLAILPELSYAQTVNIRGGFVAHDAPASGVLPLLFGCWASAAAPTNVSADVDAVRSWCLRNGASVVQLSHNGTLIDPRAVDTELGAGVTYAPGIAFPTAPIILSANLCSNGTTLDPCLKATSGQGPVDTGTQRVTLGQGSTACPNYVAISQTADTTLVSGTSSQYFYICSIILVAGAAEVVSLWEGTGTACGTGSTAILGSTTEANGLSIGANGGFSAVGGVPFLRTATAANDICLRQSGANRVSGVITYYKAP